MGDSEQPPDSPAVVYFFGGNNFHASSFKIEIDLESIEFVVPLREPARDPDAFRHLREDFERRVRDEW